MLELARDLLPLLRAGVSVAAVTVTNVARSAPRGVGATMAVTADGAVLGSISGGCVESDAIVLAHTALATGTAPRARFGFSDETAHAAGLACGGQVDVIAYRIDPADAATMAALESAADDRGTSVALVASGAAAGRVIPLPGVAPAGTALDDVALDRSMLNRAAPDVTIGDGDPSATHLAARAIAMRDSIMLPAAYRSADILLLSHAPRARLIVLGAGEHAAALCRVGAAAGFAVTVCDPWQTLVTPERFPDADRLITALPHEYLASLDDDEVDARTAVCVLTHDERLDVPALHQALTMPVGFVGAMGARRTVDHRAALLREAGVSEVDLARLHSPLGLDLGGAEPVETALSVLAEIVASRHGGSGVPLRERTGPLHRRPASTGTKAADPDAAVAASAACASPDDSLPTGAPA